MFLFVIFDCKQQQQQQKFVVTVDLSEADCKEELNVRIDSDFLVDDNESDDKWFETYSDVLNGIEIKLTNNDWIKSFELFTKVDNTLVDDLNKFVNAVKKQLSNDSKALFCIKVSVFFIFIFFIFCFFLLLLL